MVAVATALQTRILEAAEKHLGPAAGDFVRDVCRTRLGVEFQAIEYTQLNALLKAIQTEAGPILGRRTADALADDMLQLQSDVEAGLTGRILSGASRVLGPAAEPVIRNVCARLAIELEMIDRTMLPLLAQAAADDALPLLGAETADALKHTIERSASARPAGLVTHIVEAAARHGGRGGETFVRELCRRRLEIDLDDLEPDGLRPLADAIRTEGAAMIGAEAATSFAQAVAAVLISPNTALRAKIVETAKRYIGPAGEEFLRRGCRKMGMPWDAVDYEHMMWLAEVVRAESAPLIGKKSADDFARTIRGFLTGK